MNLEVYIVAELDSGPKAYTTAAPGPRTFERQTFVFLDGLNSVSIPNRLVDDGNHCRKRLLLEVSEVGVLRDESRRRFDRRVSVVEGLQAAAGEAFPTATEAAGGHRRTQ